MLNAGSIPFFFSYIEGIDPISLMFVLENMLTVLKVLEMFSSPEMPIQSSYLLVSLICFGLTVRSFVLNSYLLTSEISSAVNDLDDRSYDPSYISLVYSKWGTHLHNSEQLVEIFGSLSPKMVPNFVCRSHWRKAGWLSEAIIVIFDTMLGGGGALLVKDIYRLITHSRMILG